MVVNIHTDEPNEEQIMRAVPWGREMVLARMNRATTGSAARRQFQRDWTYFHGLTLELEGTAQTGSLNSCIYAASYYCKDVCIRLGLPHSEVRFLTKGSGDNDVSICTQMRKGAGPKLVPFSTTS